MVPLMTGRYILAVVAISDGARHNALCAGEHKCQSDQAADHSDAYAHLAHPSIELLADVTHSASITQRKPSAPLRS
jgi:hypothetical protein